MYIPRELSYDQLKEKVDKLFFDSIMIFFENNPRKTLYKPTKFISVRKVHPDMKDNKRNKFTVWVDK